MKMNQWRFGNWLAGLALAVSFPSTGMTQETPRYETGYASVARFSGDLYRALEPAQQRQLHDVPVLLEDMKTPYIQPSKHFTGTKMVSAVYISAGFVDWMNQLSHAMAINGVQRGYLKDYLKQLGEPESLIGLKNVSNQKSWSFDVMNHQISHFNQITSSMVAIDMAYHYLGYYGKYSGKLGEKQTIPMTSVITQAEWRRAVLYGAHNALQCGIGVEGLKFLLSSVDQMPTRPSWAGYFMPEGVNVRKLSKDLDRLQESFFAGEQFKI